MLRGAAILLYHRVATVDWDPWQLCVSPRHFGEHLEVLKRRATILSLRQLLDALAARRVPRRAVVLTFDDGYADNLQAAKPLLERYDMPATVFLATGAIGSGAEFWWDELEQLVSRAAELPASLNLIIDGREHEWRRPRASMIKAPSEGPSAPVREREAFYNGLWRLLQPLQACRRREALDQLGARLNARPTVRRTHRPLSAHDVEELAADGLVEIGAHTVSHPVLPRLPPERQREEIERSKAACEALTGRPISSFAYPHGERTDDTDVLVRAAGFACATVSDPGLVDHGGDRHRLSRFVVEDGNGDALARRLARGFL